MLFRSKYKRLKLHNFHYFEHILFSDMIGVVDLTAFLTTSGLAKVDLVLGSSPHFHTAVFDYMNLTIRAVNNISTVIL